MGWGKRPVQAPSVAKPSFGTPLASPVPPAPPYDSTSMSSPGEHVAEASGEATEASRQIRGSTVLLGGRVLSLVLNMATQVLILRSLTKDDYGAFAYGLSFLVTVRVLITLGHTRTITRFLAIYDERRDYARLFGTLLMETLLIGGIGAALFGAVVLFNEQLQGSLIDDPQAVSLLAVLILLGPVEAADDLLEGMCAVFSRPAAIVLRKHVAAPLLRLGVVTVLALTDAGVRFLAIGYVAAGAAGVLLYVGIVARILREHDLLAHFRLRSVVMPFREITAFSFPLLTTELVYISMNTVSIVLLGKLSGTPAVAAFRSILPAAQVNHFVRRSFGLLFIPMASRFYERGDRAGMREAYWQTAAWLTVLTFPVFALTCPFAEPVTVALFGERYAGSASYLAVLAIGLFVNAALGFNVQLLQVHGRLRYLLAVNVSAAAVSVAASLALIPPFGAMGVAVANASTIVLQNLMNQAGLRGEIGVGAVNRRLMPLYATVTATSLVLWALELALDPGILETIALAGAGSLVVVVVGRSLLDVESTLPELLRLPLARRLLVPRGRPEPAPPREPDDGRPPTADV